MNLLYGAFVSLLACSVVSSSSKESFVSKTISTYSSGKKLVSTRTVKGNDLNGPYSLFYSHGQLATQGAHAKGQRDGVWQDWHRNGQLAVIRQYEQGFEQGVLTCWWPNGHIALEGHFKLGIPDSMWTMWDSMGNVINWIDHTSSHRTNEYQYEKVDSLYKEQQTSIDSIFSWHVRPALPIHQELRSLFVRNVPKFTAFHFQVLGDNDISRIDLLLDPMKICFAETNRHSRKLNGSYYLYEANWRDYGHEVRGGWSKYLEKSVRVTGFYENGEKRHSWLYHNGMAADHERYEKIKAGFTNRGKLHSMVLNDYQKKSFRRKKLRENLAYLSRYETLPSMHSENCNRIQETSKNANELFLLLDERLGYWSNKTLVLSGKFEDEIPNGYWYHIGDDGDTLFGLRFTKNCAELFYGSDRSSIQSSGFAYNYHCYSKTIWLLGRSSGHFTLEAKPTFNVQGQYGAIDFALSDFDHLLVYHFLGSDLRFPRRQGSWKYKTNNSELDFEYKWGYAMLK